MIEGRIGSNREFAESPAKLMNSGGKSILSDFPVSVGVPETREESVSDGAVKIFEFESASVKAAKSVVESNHSGVFEIKGGDNFGFCGGTMINTTVNVSVEESPAIGRGAVYLLASNVEVGWPFFPSGVEVHFLGVTSCSTRLA